MTTPVTKLLKKLKYHFLKCHYRVSVKALVTDRDGKFLLIKESNGFWELPGGGLDHGEEPAACLRREISEEMGLKIASIAPTPQYFFTFVNNVNGNVAANVIYTVQLEDLNFTPTQECIQIKFWSASEVLNSKENFYNNVLKVATFI